MMRLAEIACPHCGAIPAGTVELCLARFAGAEPQDDVAWEGVIDCDNSTTVHQDGQPVLECDNGHYYTHPAFTDAVLDSLRLDE